MHSVLGEVLRREWGGKVGVCVQACYQCTFSSSLQGQARRSTPSRPPRARIAQRATADAGVNRARPRQPLLLPAS